jgi:hypothetical protein
MTTEQLKLQKKATALNAIRKIYNPHNYNNGKGLRSNRWDESWAEQRDEQVKKIIDQLEKELLELKQKV